MLYNIGGWSIVFTIYTIILTNKSQVKISDKAQDGRLKRDIIGNNFHYIIVGCPSLPCTSTDV